MRVCSWKEGGRKMPDRLTRKKEELRRDHYARAALSLEAGSLRARANTATLLQASFAAVWHVPRACGATRRGDSVRETSRLGGSRRPWEEQYSMRSKQAGLEHAVKADRLNGALGGGDLAVAGRAVHDEGHGLDLLVRVKAGHAH
eukprot:1189093-Prorocentrum_minimum.AAC.1